MKKSKIFLFIFSVVMTALLISCGNNTYRNINSKHIISGIYRGEHIEALDDRFRPISNMCLSDGKLFMLGTAEKEPTASDGRFSFPEYIPVIAVYDTADGSSELISTPERSQMIAVNGDRLLLVLNKYVNGRNVDTLCCMNLSDQREIWKLELNKMFGIDDTFMAQINIASSESNWYVSLNNTVKTLSLNGDMIKSHTFSDAICGLGVDPKGVMHAWGEGFHKLVAQDKITELDITKSSSLLFGGSHDFYYTDENALFGYSSESDTYTEVMNWVNSAILKHGIRHMAISSDGTVYIYGSDGLGGAQGLWKYSRQPDKTVDSSNIIKITYAENGQSSVPTAAVRFNALQESYHVICNEYTSSNTDILGELDKMMIGGTAGDILVCTSMDEVYKYARKGILTDLYSLSPDFFDNNIFPCVLNACEIDSSLYAVPQEFSLLSLAINERNIPEKAWDIESFIKLSDSLKADIYMLKEHTRNQIYSQTKSGVISAHIDLDGSSCDFLTDDFIKYLEFLKRQVITQDIDEEEEGNPYADGEIILYSGKVGNYIDHLLLENVFGENELGRIIGYPSDNGGSAKLEAKMYYSVLESSKAKAGAVSFIEYLLSAECVITDGQRMKYIPSLKQTAREWEEKEHFRYYFFDYINVGSYSMDSKPIRKLTDNAGVCAELTEEKKHEMYTYINNVSVFPYIPKDIVDIIDEEINIYLTTSKTANETAQSIQSRVNIYLGER